MPKTAAFSATAILLLALGIGANAAVFGGLNTICFRLLPIAVFLRVQTVAMYECSVRFDG